MRILINRLSGGGVCPTISPSGMKICSAVSHLLRKDGFRCTAVMEIARKTDEGDT